MPAAIHTYTTRWLPSRQTASGSMWNSAPPSSAPAATATNGSTTCLNVRSGSSSATLPTRARTLMASPDRRIHHNADTGRRYRSAVEPGGTT